MLIPKRMEVAWDRRHRADGVGAFRLGRSGEFLVAEWPGAGRLTCTPDGTHSRFVAQAGADRTRVNKLRTGAVRALVGDARGGLALHASAVALKGRALVVVGASGAGKSTVAGELCVRYGARLIADDMALLEVAGDRVQVHRTEDHHSLTKTSCRLLGIKTAERSRGIKVAVRAAKPEQKLYPLAILAVLRPDGRRRRTSVRPLAGVEVARALLGAIVRFDMQADRRRELDQIFALYERCRVLEVIRPATSSRASLVGGLLTSELEGSVDHG